MKKNRLIQDVVSDDIIRTFEKALQEAFVERRPIIVNAIVDMLQQSPEKTQQGSGAEGSSPVGWSPIDSLSSLRAIVGGRFQNLKKKWVDAGFPLREHRGDKGSRYQVDEKGWIELSSWIFKQGFEVRLTSDDSESLFEIRPNSK